MRDYIVENIDKSGYGIGLSIAQNICEQNNGDIVLSGMMVLLALYVS